MKKNILIFLTIFALLGIQYCVYGDDIDTVMQQFKAAQSKLRELRQSGASESQISAQQEKVKSLRAKVSELQSGQGQ